nr:hypothetical protein Iba_chr04dCG14290 [Ipomoea batatas]
MARQPEERPIAHRTHVELSPTSSLMKRLRNFLGVWLHRVQIKPSKAAGRPIFSIASYSGIALPLNSPTDFAAVSSRRFSARSSPAASSLFPALLNPPLSRGDLLLEGTTSFSRRPSKARARTEESRGWRLRVPLSKAFVESKRSECLEDACALQGEGTSSISPLALFLPSRADLRPRVKEGRELRLPPTRSESRSERRRSRIGGWLGAFRLTCIKEYDPASNAGLSSDLAQAEQALQLLITTSLSESSISFQGRGIARRRV